MSPENSGVECKGQNDNYHERNLLHGSIDKVGKDLEIKKIGVDHVVFIYNCSALGSNIDTYNRSIKTSCCICKVKLSFIRNTLDDCQDNWHEYDNSTR